MSTNPYDTNKYQFSIHKYLRNPNRSYSTPPVSSSSTTDYDEKSSHLYNQQQQSATTMGADSSRYSLLPHLSTEGEQTPLTSSSSRKDKRQCSMTLSTLATILRLFTIALLITSVTLLLIFFYNPYLTAVIFLFINLAEQLLVLCVAKTSSAMAFRVRIELKRNDWKRHSSAVQMGEPVQTAVREEKRRVHWGVVLLDVLAGVGTMIGGIVIAACTGSAHCILPFTIV